jgi:hypothetical protein
MVLRMMLGVAITFDGRFILHRFLTDALGHLIGAYLSIAATYAIDPHSDRPINFDHGAALALAGSIILFDFLIARFFGNGKWFGLLALAAASVAGYLLFMFGVSAFSSSTFSGEDIVGVVVMLVFFLPPALVFPLIIRLMAYPIIVVLRPNR